MKPLKKLLNKKTNNIQAHIKHILLVSYNLQQFSIVWVVFFSMRSISRRVCASIRLLLARQIVMLDADELGQVIQSCTVMVL